MQSFRERRGLVQAKHRAGCGRREERTSAPRGVFVLLWGKALARSRRASAGTASRDITDPAGALCSRLLLQAAPHPQPNRDSASSKSPSLLPYPKLHLPAKSQSRGGWGRKRVEEKVRDGPDTSQRVGVCFGMFGFCSFTLETASPRGPPFSPFPPLPGSPPLQF